MVKKYKTTEFKKFTPEQLKGWEDYRLALLLQKTKSDDLFEKAITFISSGALALTLTFHDKIVPADKAVYVILIGIGWASLIVTLFLNLISHYQTSTSIDKTIDELDEMMDYKAKYEEFYNKLEKRNKRISKLNFSSIMCLGLGLILIIIYTTLNIHFCNEKKSENIIDDLKQTVTMPYNSNFQREDGTT